MNFIEYSLFRIKFVQAKQLSLSYEQQFGSSSNPRPALLFKQALEAKPSLETRTGLFWHIGNVEHFTSEAGSFAIGKTSNTTVAKYNPETLDFVEESFEASPYTFCIYHLEIGLVAIAKKSSLAPDTAGIAAKLSELLSSTQIVKSNDVSVLIDPISDPDSFLKKIAEAQAVLKFKAWFTGPNPIDADKLFQQPLSVYCQHVAGERGAVEVEGKNLDKEVVADVARSTAATGNDASARIISRKGQAAQKIQMQKDHIRKRYPAENHDKRKVADEMAQEYKRIRTPTGVQSLSQPKASINVSDEPKEIREQ